MASPLVLLGGGGHCRAVLDVLECLCQPVAGIVVGQGEPADSALGYSVLGRDEDLETIRLRHDSALVTVGQTKTAVIRKRLFNALVEHGFFLSIFISPHAYVSRHAALGAGSVVMHHAMVNSHAVVGKNCIVNSKALLEHDCVLLDHSHVAVSATLCGGVTVGEECFIGAGAVVKQGVRIGSGSIVGMGCVVRHDLPERSLYVG